MQISFRALALAALLALPSAPAAATTILPIREVLLSDGTPRYAVDLSIDGRTVEAGLDTGSTGLRVLPRAIVANRGGRQVHYSYSSGTLFRGTTVTGAVAMGGAAPRAVPIMRIDSVGCVEERPDCPAAHTDIATFGIQGDGLPGEGFAAILGIGLKPDAVANPLLALGVRRWIVELPRRGEGPGRLILDPDAATIARYRRLSLMDDSNNLETCLTAAGQEPICGPAHFDSGAPGLRITGAAPGPRWPIGTQVRILLGGAGGPEMYVRVGDRPAGGGMLMFRRAGMRGTIVSVGNAPYFHWSVLYDADAHQIGLADRP